jgi:hypothetical protein
LKLHGVRLFALEIDRDLVDQKIDRINPPEPPALVHHIAAGLQILKSVASGGRELTGLYGLLDIGSHGGTNIGSDDQRAKKYLQENQRGLGGIADCRLRITDWTGA